ncbi:unnamed protein product [Heterobilharzia americana]|nr:unnamed protein product [Heterobilharzia americana]
MKQDGKNFHNRLKMTAAQRINYPTITKCDLWKENYFGKDIHDPYRWLEDEYSKETNEFLKFQMKLTETFLKKCPYTEEFRSYLQSMCEFDQCTCPIIRGINYFYCFKPPHLNYAVLEVIREKTNFPEIVLDPTCIGLENSEKVTAFNISDCGTYLCYEVVNSCVGWYKLNFRNIKTDSELPDCIKLFTKTSMTWSTDNKGIYYIYCIPTNPPEEQIHRLMQKYLLYIYYHKLGDEQSKDRVLWSCEMSAPNLMFCELNESGRYLLVSLFNGNGTQNKLVFGDLQHERVKTKGRLKMVPIVDEFDAYYKFLGSTATHFYIMTNMGAPFNKIIKVDIKDPEWSSWIDLIPHNPKSKIEHAVCVGQRYLAICRLENVKSFISIHEWSTGARLRKISVPIGRIYSMSGHHTSTKILSDNRKLEVFRKSEPMELKGSEFEIKQVFYEANDSTAIPMFIFHQKDLIITGKNPCKLTAFGGFGLINQPYYSASDLLFVERFKGIFVLANIRGGGEYGKQWHRKASGITKSLAVDDIIAAAEYLIHKKYTNSNNLILQGNENGGLLVASCASKRPDLFKIAILDNPLTDMLRYYKYSSTGRWIKEYGNPYHEEMFNALYSYSPIHNIPNLSTSKSCYPAVLILSDFKTANVEYIHSLKLLAALQNEVNGIPSSEQTYCMLAWLKTDGKHKIDKVTSMWAFVQIILSLKWHMNSKDLKISRKLSIDRK